MKAFALVLLCALAAVQGRHTALQRTRTAAALGENPWLVHLRIAEDNSGLLKTGAGTLINSEWVLTTSSNIYDARFIWIRYGVVNVINPKLVTEVSARTFMYTHPSYNAATGENNVALVSINRIVHRTDNIAPISIVGEPFVSVGSFCNFGEQDDGTPGERLFCSEFDVDPKEEDYLVISSDQVSAFDSGAPLVSGGAQVGILVEVRSGSGVFVKTSVYKSWIEEVTGHDLSPEAPEALEAETVRFIQ